MCDLLERYVAFLNNYIKLYATDFDWIYEDYRDINRKEKTDYFNNKLNMLPIHEQLSKLNIKNNQMEFDATAFYPSAIWDSDSVYGKIESVIHYT